MFQLDRVVAGYGDAPVLREVSLRVPEGAVVALLGPNGAGKTTLLRVASGLLAPSSGDILLDDRSLLGEPADAFSRAGICHIPEGRGIFRSMTVRENLLLQAPAGEEGSSLERAADAFPRLGERMSQRAGTMSGGEQQMLAVARAYLANPSLVLLDEVSLGLAPKIVDEIFVFLDRLAHLGSALLLVEQYIARALAIADFVFVLDHGRVAFAGEADEVDQAAVYRTYVGAEVVAS
jgi:branched-chain amino acid transport system ATP-binding protein